MDQASQENELQRAIDDITKNNGGEQGADVAANLEQQIQDQMGTPPVPPMPEGEVPAEAMPNAGEMPMPEGATPVEEVATEEVVAEAPVENVEAPAEVAPEVATVSEAPVVPEMPAEPVAEVVAAELSDMGGNDISSVKEAMLRDLFPIMDKVDMGAEEKFELYRTMLDDTNDKTLISGAYEVVKGIADEGARAEALLFLIKKADA